MKQLGSFSFLNGKLYFSSEVFSGENPLISPLLALPSLPGLAGEESVLYSIKLGEREFSLKLTYCLRFGPISGYKRVDVREGETVLLQYEWGGRGFGSNYVEGLPYRIVGGEALLFIKAQQLRAVAGLNDFLQKQSGFHLLLFKGITQHKREEQEQV